jgi:hypothetical protein
LADQRHNLELVMTQAIATTDHKVIRQWIEDRDGHPAYVKATEGKGGGGLLRVDFGEQEDSLDRIDWDEFFETFEQSNLAFLYQERTAAGGTSRFAKFVARDNADLSGAGESEDEDSDAAQDADEADDELDDDDDTDVDEDEDLDDDDDFDDDDEEDDDEEDDDEEDESKP